MSEDPPVYTDVSYFRDEDCIVYFNVVKGKTCPECGSGEVYIPGQTFSLPMVYTCIRCGEDFPIND